jgi:hypothetical protein
MKRLRKILFWFIGILVILNLWIVLSDHTYLYKGIANTYLKGRKGPSIDEYLIFENRKVDAPSPQPWTLSKSYNKKKITEK